MRDHLSRERRNLPWELVRKAINLRGRARDADTQRTSSRDQPTGHLSRDVQPPTAGPHTLDTGRALLRLLL